MLCGGHNMLLKVPLKGFSVNRDNLTSNLRSFTPFKVVILCVCVKLNENHIIFINDVFNINSKIFNKTQLGISI